MRITKITATRLGALSHDSLEGLGGALNIVYGPNEAGKTTLKQALRIALFPIERGKAANTYAQRRVSREVSLEFADADRTYKVTRIASKPQVSKPLEGSAESLEAFKSLVGDVSLETYLMLFHIGADDISAIAGSDISLLTAAQWGSLANPVQIEHQLEAKLDQFIGTKAAKRPYSITALTADIDAQDKRIAESQHYVSTLNEKQAQLDARRDQCQQRESDLALLRSSLERLDQDRADLGRAIDSRDSNRNLLEVAMLHRQEDKAGLETQLDDCRIEAQHSQNGFARRSMLVPTIIGVALAALIAFVLSVFLQDLLIPLTAGALVLIATLIYDWRLSTKAYRVQAEAASEFTQSMDTKIAKLEARLDALCALQEQDNQALETIDARLSAAVDALIQRWRLHAVTAEDALTAMSEHRSAVLATMSEQDSQLALLREEIGSLNNAIQYIREQHAPHDAIIAKTNLEAKRDYALAQTERYQTALELLRRAQESFAPNTSITDEASRLFRIMTNGRFRNVVVDNDDELLVINAQGDALTTNRLSRGTADLLLLALRFGVLLAKDDLGQNLPIILDETCAHLDNERFEAMCLALGDLATRRQIIYFTCHKDRADRMKDLVFPLSNVRRIDRAPVT